MNNRWFINEWRTCSNVACPACSFSLATFLFSAPGHSSCLSSLMQVGNLASSLWMTRALLQPNPICLAWSCHWGQSRKAAFHWNPTATPCPVLRWHSQGCHGASPCRLELLVSRLPCAQCSDSSSDCCGRSNQRDTFWHFVPQMSDSKTSKKLRYIESVSGHFHHRIGDLWGWECIVFQKQWLNNPFSYFLSLRVSSWG